MAPCNKSSVGTTDRRRRPRVNGITEGWVIRRDQDISDPWEVRVRDVSRRGVGFESSEQLASGEVIRLRIGRGPMKLARKARITRCAAATAGTFTLGAEFI